MYLVMTSLREYWPKKGAVWLLTPGCIPDPDDLDLDGRWEIKGAVSDPFNTKEDLTLAYKEIWRLTNDLIKLLSPRLNKIHNTVHSDRYWRTLLGFCSLAFVTMIYDLYFRLLKAKSELSNIEVVGLDNVNPIIPSDTSEFTCEGREDLYNVQIYTFLCEKLGISIVEYKAAVSCPQLEETQSFRQSFSKNIIRKVWMFTNNILLSIFSKRADVLMHTSYLPRWFEMALSLVTFGKIFPLHLNKKSIDNVPSEQSVNEEMRSTLNEIPDNYDGIDALLVEMIGLCIPKSFVEEYQYVCASSDKLYKRYRPKAIYSTISWYIDEPFKHWAAICQEEGSKLIGGEHGGAPFNDKFKLLEFLEISISDYYLTWGWKDARNSKVIPVPANKLIKILLITCLKNKADILYISTAEPRHNLWRLENFLTHIEWQERFYKSVSPDLIEKFLVRLHYNDYGWNIKNRLAKCIPALQFDSWQVSLRKRLSYSRLNVFDYIGTSCTEALSMNVPTIIFSNNELFPTSEDMSDFGETICPNFKALRDVNVLHDSPESAAAWVEKVYNDPDAWWFSDDCQKVVKNFCSRYAYISKSPLKEWKETLESLVSR